MLICIGSDESNLKGKVARRFGHANYLIVYNTETKHYEAYLNNNQEHNHDNLPGYLEKGVRIYIVGNIGPHAFEILASGGAEIYLARKIAVEEAISLYAGGKLQKLFEPTAKKNIGHGKHEHK